MAEIELADEFIQNKHTSDGDRDLEKNVEADVVTSCDTPDKLNDVIGEGEE